MKNKNYLVKFKTGIYSRQYASCENTAKILAQAEQIKEGNNYDVESIVEVDK